MATKKVMISIDEEVLEKLDNKRGLIPRSAYINALIKKDLEGKKD